MNPSTKAIILSCNTDAERICSSAARISTTSGSALDLYHTAEDTEKNRKLIRAVIKSGHRSVIEHAVFHLAFNDVSVAVEEFLIEFRLASYTVKSRRYVDFGHMGYYVPQDLTADGEKCYREHIESLFADYNFFVERGVPKEDARFVLPYAFFSNFYCTVNARELIHMVNEMKYGRGSCDPELTYLADMLLSQLQEIFPEAAEQISPDQVSADSKRMPPARLKLSDKPNEVCASAELLRFPADGERLLRECASVLSPDGASMTPDEILHLLPRAAEQLNLTYKINNLSLSSVTHLVRHRIQSLAVPALTTTDIMRYIVPESISANAELLARYRAAFARNAQVLLYLRTQGLGREVSLCMSGNTLHVMTTANARELMLFFRLRTCTRAQWEIRDVAQSMLLQAQANVPAVFDTMGPSCVVLGHCPEGRMCCGRAEEMRARFLKH